MGEIRSIGEEDREELRIRQQALQNQFLEMQGAAGAPADGFARGLEEEAEQAPGDEAVPRTYLSALERLKGRRDAYVPSKGSGLVTNTDRVDGEIRDLREQVKDLEKRSGEARDPAEAERLKKELEAAQARLQAKDNDVYRRQYAQYTPLR